MKNEDGDSSLVNSENNTQAFIKMIERQKLTVSMMPYAAKMAARMMLQLNIPMAMRSDVEAAAYLGLTEAAHRSDTLDDERFRGFAVLRIRGAVVDFLRKQGYYSPTAYKAIKNYVEGCCSRKRIVEYFEDHRGCGEVIDGGDTPEEQLLQGETCRMLSELIEALPKKEREVVVHRYIRGGKLSDLVQEGAQLPSISKHHSKALRRLRWERLA
jgi:RNA polymerase sigma factor for flagellar operon FliA